MSYNGTSRTMAQVTFAVRQSPGHTAYWYDQHCLAGRAMRGRTYSAFDRAVRRGLISRAKNPAMKGSTIYQPVTQ